MRRQLYKLQDGNGHEIALSPSADQHISREQTAGSTSSDAASDQNGASSTESRYPRTPPTDWVREFTAEFESSGQSLMLDQPGLMDDSPESSSSSDRRSMGYSPSMHSDKSMEEENGSGFAQIHHAFSVSSDTGLMEPQLSEAHVKTPMWTLSSRCSPELPAVSEMEPRSFLDMDFMFTEDVFHPPWTASSHVRAPSLLPTPVTMDNSGNVRAESLDFWPPNLAPGTDCKPLWRDSLHKTPAYSTSHNPLDTKLSNCYRGRIPDADASLLHLAVAGGNIETVKLILKESPHLAKTQDRMGYIPAQLAAIAGHTQILALFLQPDAGHL